ncbi:MAG: thioredoxin domain-containing protein [Candidatus Sulfotelmatobacter sp.]
MSFLQRVLGLGLGAALMLAGTTIAAAQDDSGVVAEVGGVKITMSELEQQESAKLLGAHYQYYQIEIKALDELIDRKLIEQKAKSEHLTVDQLFDRDIKPLIKDPTEDQMEVYYEGLETDQPYEVVRGKILEKIRQLRTDKARAAYASKLRTESTVYVTLAPPRVDVGVETAQMIGPKDAPVTLIEFADYECPYCQKVAPDLKKLQAEFGDKVAYTYRDFPLPMHPQAEKAAEAARCAGEQGKFWEFHDELFQSKELDFDQLKVHAQALKLDTARFNKCLDSGDEAAAVGQDRKEGQRLGLTGTPSFFINGHFLSGAVDYATLRGIVQQQLAESSRVAAVTPAK